MIQRRNIAHCIEIRGLPTCIHENVKHIQSRIEVLRCFSIINISNMRCVAEGFLIYVRALKHKKEGANTQDNDYNDNN